MIHYRFFTLTLTLSSKRKERHSPSPRPSPFKGEGDYGSGLQRERESKDCGFQRGKEGDFLSRSFPIPLTLYPIPLFQKRISI